MSQPHTGPEPSRFGLYLRRIRESRKLSLDAVEELALGYPDRITKSHLSRIENGLAEPSFRRMYALSRIYAIPVTELAERFERTLAGEQAPDALTTFDDPEALLEAATRERRAGLLRTALDALDRVLYEWHRYVDRPEWRACETRLRGSRVEILQQLGFLDSAKSEIEILLESDALTADERVRALVSLGTVCLRMRRRNLASLAVSNASDLVDRAPEAIPEDVATHVAFLDGLVRLQLGELKDAARRLTEAADAYERRGDVFNRAKALRRLGEARLRLKQPKAAGSALRKALELAEAHDFARVRCLALSDLAEVAELEGDVDRAESYAVQSNSIARPRGYDEIVFRNCYKLWISARERGDAAARGLNERTLKNLLPKVPASLEEAIAFRRAIAEEVR